MLLQKKAALVSGVSRGIGRAIALELAREGADVVVNYAHSDEKAAEVARTIDALGRKALVVKADVARQDQVEAMRKEVAKQFSGVDILVNNAGAYHHYLKSWEIDEPEWRHVLGVNLDGTFLCSRTVEEKRKALELIPLGRIRQPGDIAYAAAFLASNPASFITGQTIHLNGGEAMF
jgi:3-oxoacyl-[acyl-carrier protein] reductase